MITYGFVPRVPPAKEEIAALHAANARLREVIEAKDADAAALRAQLEACQGQLKALGAETSDARPAAAGNADRPCVPCWRPFSR